MDDQKTTPTTAATKAASEAPALVKKIGKTTCRVRVHFSTTSKETMNGEPAS